MIDISLLNSVQMNAIEELQKRVEDVMPADLFGDRILLYRFLKARDFNLDKAEKMLKKNIEFRKHYQINTLLESFKPKEFFIKIAQPSSIGFDKDGDMVMYCPVGNLDGRDVLKCVTMNDYMMHWIWLSENWSLFAKNKREKDGKKSLQYFLLWDLTGLTFANTTSKASSETVLRILTIIQDNFPESLKRMAVINAPSYYVVLFSLIKPFLSAATLQKIQIYSHSGWKEMLLETIDAEVLPAFLGGKKTDPDGDPFCKTFIGFAGWMPKKYYLTEGDRGFKDISRVRKISVASSSQKNIYFEVPEEGSVIQWELLLKGKDIRFGLFFQGLKDVVEILPLQKHDTLDGVERGFYKTKFTGKYFITFDNSYSWLNSKEIEYCITVLKTEA